jgi:hypothetical protein
VCASKRGTRGTGAANLRLRSAGEHEEVEKLSDRMTFLRRVTHLDLRVDGVAVPPADTSPSDVAGFDEVDDDPLSRPLGDPDVRGGVPQPCVRVLGDAQQHLSVVCEERPGRVFLSP